jgi:hypothetical protein
MSIDVEQATLPTVTARILELTDSCFAPHIRPQLFSTGVLCIMHGFTRPIRGYANGTVARSVGTDYGLRTTEAKKTAPPAVARRPCSA